MHVLIDANVPLNVWLGDRPIANESAAIMEAVGEGAAYAIHPIDDKTIVEWDILRIQRSIDPS